MVIAEANDVITIIILHRQSDQLLLLQMVTTLQLDQIQKLSKYLTQTQHCTKGNPILN